MASGPLAWDWAWLQSGLPALDSSRRAGWLVHIAVDMAVDNFVD
jgi:hypothetical protein